jgi:divalent metal cation (Fe/Co/Zn/Cd) transporter
VIRQYHAPTGGTESLGTVGIAFAADLAMVAAKAVAALATGSAALFAETLHSLADTNNQLLLLKGLRGSRRQPDISHPFGYGAELFYWSLLAALGVFVVGGVLSIWEGIQRLLHPSEVQAGLLGLAVLGLGCLLDGSSWLGSVRQLRREASARGIPFRQHLRSTTDAVAGIVIGLLLAAVGLRLAARNRVLLTNRSESPVVLDRIHDLLTAHPEVAAVGRVTSVYVGPHQLLVTADIQPLDTISSMRLRQLLAELRERVTAAIPRATLVLVTPAVAVNPSPELTPWDHDYWLQRFPDHEQA